MALPITLAAVVAYNASTPLNHYPIVLAHDAATGYLNNGGTIKDQLIRWTKTQAGTPRALLDCGARGFDWRPQAEKDKLVMHHGDVVVEYPMPKALEEMVAWSNNHTAPEDLVLLYVWDCAGDNCDSMVATALQNASIASVTDCTALAGMTVGDAVSKGAHPGGGHILAITGATGCVNQHYDPSQTCYGTNKGKEYTCYNTSTTRDYPFGRMNTYLSDVATPVPSSNGELWEMQAIWQESTETVVIGETKGSNLLLDEVRSGLNAMLTANVLKGVYPHANLVLVNNVCDGGNELRLALQKMFP